MSVDREVNELLQKQVVWNQLSARLTFQLRVKLLFSF